MKKSKLPYSFKYTTEEQLRLATEVLLLIPTKGTNGACKAAGVARSTFTNWMEKEETYAARYACARVDYIENIAQEIIDISDGVPSVTDKGNVDTGDVQSKRLRVDARKWLLSKLAPKRYGERLTVAGDEAAPLTIERITRVVVDPRKEDQ